MKTNRDKYEQYRLVIEEKDTAAIAALIPNGVPSQFYRIEQYEAVPTAVTGLSIYRRGIYKPAADERMTKIEVECAKQCAESWKHPQLSDILVGYEYKQKIGTVRGAHPYSKIEDDPVLAWTFDELQPEIERRRALYAPREGCKACAYCRKQTPESEMVKCKIFYRDICGSATRFGLYCSSQCGGYDQMGSEG